MYVFLVLALPLGFVLLVLSLYPREEVAATRRACLRGLLASIPLVLVARILGALVPDAPGSAMGIFHEWAARHLPYAAFPALLYLVFYRYGERLPLGAAARRLTSFYAGALAPMGLFETLRIWGGTVPYELFLLPVLMSATALIMPRLALSIHLSYGFRVALLIAAALVGSLGFSSIPFLFVIRLWPLGCLLAAIALWLGWALASPELSRRPPPISE